NLINITLNPLFNLPRQSLSSVPFLPKRDAKVGLFFLSPNFISVLSKYLCLPNYSNYHLQNTMNYLTDAYPKFHP
ncbi:hypothetical protein, partial [Pedobacter nutrimenti]|uniref:hypothetical protein n=1 Tax=Pedobacter nutrimenti TaxID=1241337 RepID=UPI001B85E5B3